MWLLLASLPLLVIVALLHTGRLVPKSAAAPRESTPAAIERLEHELDVLFHDPATCRLCAPPIRQPYLDIIPARSRPPLTDDEWSQVYSWGNPKPIREYRQALIVKALSPATYREPGSPPDIDPAVFATEVFHGSGITDHNALD